MCRAPWGFWRVGVFLGLHPGGGGGGVDQLAGRALAGGAGLDHARPTTDHVTYAIQRPPTVHIAACG